MENEPDGAGEKPMTSALRDARDAHGWTLAQTATQLMRLAEARGVALAVTKASLRQMISDMERGRRKPGHYKPLLCDLFGRTAAELGFPDEAAVVPVQRSSGLGELLDRAASVTPASVADLQRQVDGLRTLDRQLGSPIVVESTGRLVAVLDELMAHVLSEEIRRSLAAVLSDAAALNGWQVLNSGDTREAWRLHTLSRSAGRESGNPALLAHAMGEQAYDLLDADRAGDALGLVQAARSAAGSQVPGLLASWLAAVEAEVLAANGDASGCRDRLRMAEEAMPTEPDNTETPYVSLDDWHLDRWRGNILASLGDSAALDSLLHALDRTPATFVRATASLHCDVAHSYAVRGDRVASLEHARTARDLARRTGSVRQLRRVERVSRLLA